MFQIEGKRLSCDRFVHVQQQLVGFSAVCIWMDGLGMGKIGGIG
jgi:hypothetical protein